jgi:hypothetical protein
MRFLYLHEYRIGGKTLTFWPFFYQKLMKHGQNSDNSLNQRWPNEARGRIFTK